MSIRNADDKFRVLKERMESQRQLGAQIDVLMRQADEPTPGCNVCDFWRRLTGRQKSAVLAAVAEGNGMNSSTAAATSTTTTTQSRIFGTRKVDPSAKLAEAAASMELRVKQLECKASSEREEAKTLMQAGNKTAAMRMLKRAKATEKQLEITQSSLMAVEQQVDMMTQANLQKQLASALASSSKSMKGQKKLLKNAESAVDDAQDARDMADDLSNVMADFANHGNNDADDADLIAELQQMCENDPMPPPTDMVNVPLDSDAKTAEIARLEARITRYDEKVEARSVAATMPAVPTKAVRSNGKTAAQLEKQSLLASVVLGQL